MKKFKIGQILFMTMIIAISGASLLKGSNTQISTEINNTMNCTTSNSSVETYGLD